MNILWTISYVVLWLLVIIGGLVILALAKEIESLHKRLKEILDIISSPNRGKKENERFVENSKKTNKSDK
jgi:predicted Holliday junction resolvase-like endonuclease